MPILILTHFDDINPEQASDTRCYPTTNPLWKLMFICGCLFRLVWNTLFHMQSSVSTGMEPFSFICRRQFRRVHADTSQAITNWQNRQQLLQHFLRSTNLWLWIFHLRSGVSTATQHRASDAGRHFRPICNDVNANIDFDHFACISIPSKQATTRCYPTTNPLWKLMFICGCLFRLVWNTLFHMQSSVSTGMEPFSFIRRRQFRRVHADTSQAITNLTKSTTTFT